MVGGGMGVGCVFSKGVVEGAVRWLGCGVCI